MGSTKYTKEILSEAVASSTSISDVLRYFGLQLAGGTHFHISKKIREYEIDTSHFTGRAWSKGVKFPPKRPTEEVLVILPAGSHRPKRQTLLRCMLESGMEYSCVCGLKDEWQGQPITLEIDHISGDWLDNRIENLRFLCPNCHSQQKYTNVPYKYRNREPKTSERSGSTLGRTRKSSPERKCLDCSSSISSAATRCKSCAKTSLGTKINWPPVEELLDMLDETNYTVVARQLGVSDNAIRKHIKNHAPTA